MSRRVSSSRSRHRRKHSSSDEAPGNFGQLSAKAGSAGSEPDILIAKLSNAWTMLVELDQNGYRYIALKQAQNVRLVQPAANACRKNKPWLVQPDDNYGLFSRM